MKYTRLLSAFITLSVTLSVCTTADAQTLLGWENGSGTTGTGAAKNWASSSNDANVEEAAWTAGAGIYDNNPDAWGDDRFRNFLAFGGDAQGAVDGDYYFEFTIDPVDGYQVSVESLNIFGSIGNGNVSLALRSSVDDYDAQLGSSVVVSSGTDQVLTWTLPGTAHDNLTTPVTFRLYGHSTASLGVTLNFGDQVGDDVWVVGTTSPVPEPATAMLVVAGLGLALCARRRVDRRTTLG